MKKIGIVGRVNVGKSSLFNVLTEERRAIVSEIAGTTRDFLTADFLNNKGEIVAQLIDFGGIEFTPQDEINTQVQDQVRGMVGSCDLILFVVDVRSGPTHEDMRIRDLVLKTKKPVVLVINKVDSDRQLDGIYEFHRFGIDDILAISVSQHRNLLDLREIIYRHVGNDAGQIRDVLDLPKIAFIGRPNAGKSSLFNKITDTQRSIVSSIPGTTRDVVDMVVEIGGVEMMVLDTAGLRRKTRVTELLEGYATKIALATIRRADIICYVIDHTDGIVAQDIKLLTYIEEQAKNCIVVMNKWDLAVKGSVAREYEQQMAVDYSIFSQLPIAFLSAKTGKGVEQLGKMIASMIDKSHHRISTGKLNQYLPKMLSTIPGIYAKVKYATQVGTHPLQFVFFVNKADAFSKKTIEVFKKRIRTDFDLQGIGMEIILKEQNRTTDR